MKYDKLTAAEYKKTRAENKLTKNSCNKPKFHAINRGSEQIDKKFGEKTRNLCMKPKICA